MNVYLGRYIMSLYDGLRCKVGVIGKKRIVEDTGKMMMEFQASYR